MAKEESLRNEVDIEIPYISNDGKKGLKKVHIMFISQGIYNSYASLINDSVEVIKLKEELDLTVQKMGQALHRVSVVKNDEGHLTTVKAGILETREKLKELQTSYDKVIARINDISDHMAERKHNLIQKILKKNAIEDSDLFSREWWEECTEVAEDMKFIHAACEKDSALLSDKKKVLRTEKHSI